MPKQPHPRDEELYAACSQGNAQKVETLLADGADLKFSDPVYEYTPLHIGKSPLSQKSDVVTKTLMVFLYYTTAAEGGRAHCAELLLNEADTRAMQEPVANARDEHGQTALMLAAYNGHDEVVKVLLGAGAEPRLRNKDGSTAEDFAREEDNDMIIELLAAKIQELRTKEQAQAEEEPVQQLASHNTASGTANPSVNGLYRSLSGLYSSPQSRRFC